VQVLVQQILWAARFGGTIVDPFGRLASNGRTSENQAA
jgi:hypothetical protein